MIRVFNKTLAYYKFKIHYYIIIAIVHVLVYEAISYSVQGNGPIRLGFCHIMTAKHSLDCWRLNGTGSSLLSEYSLRIGLLTMQAAFR